MASASSPQGNGGTTSGRSDRYHRRSIKNRAKGLRKKAYELATLCDVELALVCYPSDDAEPTTWPPDRSRIEDSIHRYLDTPAHKKIPKNQITLNNPNPGADGKKEATEAAAAKAKEEADPLRIPFSDDEDRGGAEDDRSPSDGGEEGSAAVRWRSGEEASGRNRECQWWGSEAVHWRYAGRARPGSRWTAAASCAATACRTDPRTSDRDRGKSVAGDYSPVWGSGHQNFSAASAATARGGGSAPNFWYPCPCCYCPIHGSMLSGWRGR